jgi:hypothetical protein
VEAEREHYDKTSVYFTAQAKYESTELESASLSVQQLNRYLDRLAE